MTFSCFIMNSLAAVHLFGFKSFSSGSNAVDQLTMQFEALQTPTKKGRSEDNPATNTACPIIIDTTRDCAIAMDI